MKEQTLLEMKNKVESLTNVIQHLIKENMQLREIGIGTLETLKLMPGYEQAIKDLKENLMKAKEKEKEPKLE
jgi:predicted CopG family antitoxin|tara:strand:+ start:583 stop:798 length:216 start_codon:yes stop_codon:yes gene_type:complete